MSAYGYRDAYWNEGAYSVGALIDKNKFEEALILEGTYFCLVGNIFYYVGCEERPDPWLYNNKITLFKLVISIGKYVLALWAWSGEVNSLFSLFSFFFHNWTQIS